MVGKDLDGSVNAIIWLMLGPSACTLGLTTPSTLIIELPHSWYIRCMGYGLSRNRLPVRRAFSTLRGYLTSVDRRIHNYGIHTSTSWRMHATKISKEALRHPTSTPSFLILSASDGQKILRRPFPTTIATLLTRSERAAALQLLTS